MAFKNYIAFGAGEISPEIYERGNLDKFRTGLATLRNCTVTKMGGLRGRGGTVRLTNSRQNNEASYIYVHHVNKLFEFTFRNVRVYSGYDIDTEAFTSAVDISTSIITGIEPDPKAFYYPEKMHFTVNETTLVLFVEGQQAQTIDLKTNAIVPLWIRTLPDSVGGAGQFSVAAAGTPSGYLVDYTFTTVANGVESFPPSSSLGHAIPTGGNQSNLLTYVINKLTLNPATPVPSEVKFYRRPAASQAYGLIGVSAAIGESATSVTYQYRDIGGAADFSDRPPTWQANYKEDSISVVGTDPVFSIKAKTGLFFQDRLIFSGSKNKSFLMGSRTGALVMTRDIPLQDDSAIAFKNGSNGGALVRRLLDARGLMVFTAVGAYETPEILTPSTAYSVKRSSFVIDENVEAISIGDYVFFYDSRIKAVLGMVPTDNGGWRTSELSIFSCHLFEDRKVVSWAVQNNDTQVLWVVMDDGKMVSLSFQDEQQLRSWARHDMNGFVEKVVIVKGSDNLDRVLFLVKRGENRTLERLSDQNSSLMNYVGSDGSVIYQENFHIGVEIDLTEGGIGPGQWTLDAPASNFANTAGRGAAGSIFRVFREDGFSMDFEVVEYNGSGQLYVIPLDGVEVYAFFNSEPSDVVHPTSFYRTWNTFTGLEHLNGYQVDVRLDGFTHSAPLDVVNPRPVYTVSGGQITLDEGLRGAIVSIGLPYVQDVVTLEVDTVEQSPTKDQSMICNKMHLSYYKSREVYTAAKLPTDDTTIGMYKHAYQTEPDDGIVIKIPPLISERRELMTEGDWKTKGSVALRNVEPQPFGLRAIILDLEIRKR